MRGVRETDNPNANCQRWHQRTDMPDESEARTWEFLSIIVAATMAPFLKRVICASRRREFALDSPSSSVSPGYQRATEKGTVFRGGMTHMTGGGTDELTANEKPIDWCLQIGLTPGAWISFDESGGDDVCGTIPYGRYRAIRPQGARGDRPPRKMDELLVRHTRTSRSAAAAWAQTTV